MSSHLTRLQLKPGRSRLILLTADHSTGILSQLAAMKASLHAGGPVSPSVASAPGPHRLSLVARDDDQLVQWIDLATRRIEQGGARAFQLRGNIFYTPDQAARVGPADKVAFLFPGQGSQFHGMFDELCVLYPQFRSWLVDLDAAVADLPVTPPSDLAYSPAAANKTGQAAIVGLRGGAQLGVVTSIALHQLLTDFGVTPDMIVGHSNGENAGLFASGQFDIGRAGLMDHCRKMLEVVLAQGSPERPEAMAAVSLADRQRVDRVVAEDPDVYLAMTNCPSQMVIAGLADAVARAADRLRASGCVVLDLPFRRAYHTPLFGDLARSLADLYSDAKLGSARIPLYSCLTASPYPQEPDRIRAHARDQLMQTIDFESAARRLYDDGARVFLEIGPGNSLSGFVNDTLRGRSYHAMTVARAGQSALAELLRLLGRLFALGVGLNFESGAWQTLVRGGFAMAPVRPRETPPAPEPRRHAVPVQPRPAAAKSEIVRAHFALMNEFLEGQERIIAQLASTDFSAADVTPSLAPTADRTRRVAMQRRITVLEEPLLADHSLGPRLSSSSDSPEPLAVVPFTYSLELAASAALELSSDGVVTSIADVRALRWLALDRGQLDIIVRAEAQVGSSEKKKIQIFELTAAGEKLAFEASVEVSRSFPQQAADVLSFSTPAGRKVDSRWTAEAFFRDYAFHGPSFRSLRQVELTQAAGLEAELVVPARPAGATRHHIDPALLDTAGQLVGFWLLEQGHENFGIFPFSLHRFLQQRVCPAPGSTMRARAEIRSFERGMTDAAIQFFDDSGRLVYHIDGFAQRYVTLPPCLAATLMGTHDRPRFVSTSRSAGGVIERAIDQLPRSVMNDSFGIWRRALAPQALTASELQQWYVDLDQDIPWLLERIAAKEAVREWLHEQHGVDVPSTEISITEHDSSHLAAKTSLLEAAIKVRVKHQGERVFAQILRTA